MSPESTDPLLRANPYRLRPLDRMHDRDGGGCDGMGGWLLLPSLASSHTSPTNLAGPAQELGASQASQSGHGHCDLTSLA